MSINKKTYYERNKERILERLKNKYLTDSDFRNKIKEKYKSKYHLDEEYRLSTINRSKNHYQLIKKTAQETNKRHAE